MLEMMDCPECGARNSVKRTRCCQCGQPLRRTIRNPDVSNRVIVETRSTQSAAEKATGELAKIMGWSLVADAMILIGIGLAFVGCLVMTVLK